MKQTILIISLANLLFTGVAYADKFADQRADKETRQDSPQMQQPNEQQLHRYPPRLLDRAPVIIKLLQRKAAQDKVRTYHT